MGRCEERWVTTGWTKVTCGISLAELSFGTGPTDTLNSSAIGYTSNQRAFQMRKRSGEVSRFIRASLFAESRIRSAKICR